MYENDQQLSAPGGYTGQQQNPTDGDFDFDNDTVNDSMRGGAQNQQIHQQMGPPTTSNYNPLLNHQLGAGDTLAKEKEEIDLRGRVLLEQLENKGVEPHNQLRIGGNHFNVNDPNKPPYTPFYLMLTGHVQSGTFDD